VTTSQVNMNKQNINILLSDFSANNSPHKTESAILKKRLLKALIKHEILIDTSSTKLTKHPTSDPIYFLLELDKVLFQRFKVPYELERQMKSPDYRVRGEFYYGRPYFDDLIKYLVTHPSAKLCVCHNIERRSLIALIMMIFNIKKLKPYK
jgi:hypothetical protein